MEELEAICQDLDTSTEAIMDTVEQILKCQVELETLMKHGYLCMAKARYNIGLNRISALQYHEEDLEEASAKVKVTTVDDVIEFNMDNDEAEHSEDPPREGIRLRKAKSGKDGVEDIANDMKDLTVQDNPKGNQKKNDESQSQPRTKSNPLKWFGVLVPQALRQSQGHFQKSIEHSCRLATLKANLVQLREKHRTLMIRKYELAPPKEDEDCDSCSEYSEDPEIDNC